MGSSIEEVARSWLADPAWQKVFKHTFDVIEDYVSYVLVALGAISLSVKLLTTLSTGDLGCNSMHFIKMSMKNTFAGIIQFKFVHNVK